MVTIATAIDPLSPQAIVADTVFDGSVLHHDSAVIVEGPRIAALVRRDAVPPDVAVRVLPHGAWLAPGFIDIQVNGGGDVLFNDAPTAEGIRAIAAAHRRFGTTALLPTLITDTPEKMRAARAAAEAAMAGEPAVLGIHFEGPFLSPERPGVHDPALIRIPEADDLLFLTAPFPGVILVTLAPELMPPGFVAALAAAGVRVALGHSAATYDQTRSAMREGLSGFTHLFNAMPPLLSRAPGPIAAALEEPGAWYGLIVDGEHVAAPVLRLALRGAGQAVLVTDAMPPVGGARPGFALYGEDIAVLDGKCTRADGALAGSILDMASAVRNCVSLLGLPLDAALCLAGAAPAAALRLDDRLGHIRPGYRADFVALQPETVEIVATWVAGRGGEGLEGL